MDGYKRILVAIDIYSEYDAVLKRALQIAKKPDDLSLVFVTLPTIYFQPYASGFSGDLVSDIREQAKKRLTELAEFNGIPKEQVYLPIGNAADEIHAIAEENHSDVIVIGTHGQSGLKLFLGSTANAVLHGVKQDVLAVRV